MLKRSKKDEDDRPAGADHGAVLVLNEDEDACELVARLVESAGLTAVRSYDLGGVVERLEEGDFSAVVVDSLGGGISAAFKVLDEVRNAGPEVRDLAVVILAATDTNRLFAFQSGVDAYIVRPVHASELLDEIRRVLDRDVSDRAAFRRAQLMGGATTA